LDSAAFTGIEARIASGILHFAFRILRSVLPLHFGNTPQMEGGAKRSIQNQNTECKMQKSFGAKRF